MEQTQKEVFNLKMRIFPKGKRAMGHFASTVQGYAKARGLQYCYSNKICRRTKNQIIPIINFDCF